MDYLLDPEGHENLIRELDFISIQTGVPKNFITGFKAKDYCSEGEMSFIKNIKRLIKDGHPGSIFIADPKGSSALTKMHSVAATLIRNFVDARVIPLMPLLSRIKDKAQDIHETSVIIIPDLCEESYLLQKWEQQQLHGFFLERFGEGRMIIGHADSLKSMNIVLGNSLAKYFKEHYEIFEGNCINPPVTAD